MLAGVFSTREQKHVQRTSQHRRAEPCRYGKVKKRFVKLILTRVVCKNVVFHIASQERNQDLKLPCKVHADLLFLCKCRRRVDVGVLREEKRFFFRKPTSTRLRHPKAIAFCIVFWYAGHMNIVRSCGILWTWHMVRCRCRFQPSFVVQLLGVTSCF